ncbi:agamous-like MADS-box protein AGL86 [Salvia divinorum]|uniref:Agamous-like MADS-box protein AGL86 n=1 Tax=Salvia divinorum TaxID=28513 RepID=A0ABD1IF39_SALDI
MGRRKLKLEFIVKEKSRLQTLKNRREGLKKKLDQLRTLCDVPACMIIRDRATNFTSVWPEDSSQVRRLIDSYRANPSAVKAYGMSDFFKERQRNAEEELAKLRKKDVESKYPTWDHRLDLMDESKLRELSEKVRAKAEAVRSRIDFLKREVKEEEKSNVILDLGEFEEIVGQDEIFSIADGMAGTSADAQLPVVPEYYYCPPPPLKGEAMMKRENNNNNNVMLGLDGFEDIVDEDGRYSVADVMAVAMSANAQLPVPDHYFPPQDYIFSVADVMSAMSGNGQLPLPDYHCPPPLNLPPLPQPFFHDYCYPMDVNQNANWCALNMDQNLNCSSLDVNWYGGDDGGDLASIFGSR